MPNPVNSASDSFWQVTRDFDKVSNEAGLGTSSLQEQFERIARIDTDKIRDVASQAWGKGDTSQGISASAKSIESILDDTLRHVAEGWDGKAYLAFDKRLSEIRDALGKLVEPSISIAEALDEMATKFEESVSDSIGQVSVVGTVISAAAGLTFTLATLPEAVWTKILAVLTGVTTLLFGIVGVVGALIKSVEKRTESTVQVIDACNNLLKEMP